LSDVYRHGDERTAANSRADLDRDTRADLDCDTRAVRRMSRGVTELTLRYTGTAADAHVQVLQKKGDVVFDGVVQPGETFTFRGIDKDGKLGTEITIAIDGRVNTALHTSCSKPIGPGLVSGDFEVVAGHSKDGGPLCSPLC
jgi:hypothetical protein